MLLKMSWSWLRSLFHLFNYLVLELAWQHFSGSKRISWESISIWLAYSGSRIIHRLWSINIFPKTFCFRCQFGKIAYIYIIPRCKFWKSSVFNKKSAFRYYMTPLVGMGGIWSVVERVWESFMAFNEGLKPRQRCKNVFFYSVQISEFQITEEFENV